MDDGHGPTCTCKVGRVADAYLQDDVHDDLRRRWLGEGTSDHSVRELETYFNTLILKRVLDDLDVEILEGEVENMYRLLTGEGSSGMETQVRRKLERNGVDVDELTGNFVSHQSIYRHLTTCLDAEKDATMTEQERIEKERDRLNRLQNRAEAVSETALDRLRRNDAIDLCEYDVIVNFRVACEECGAHRKVSDLLQRGGCDCRRSDANVD